MKKLFSVLLAAVLAAGTMVLPTAAADGDIVYLYRPYQKKQSED